MLLTPLIIERMSREVSGGVGARRHHAPAVLARGVERLARQLSGDTASFDGPGTSV